MTCWWKERFSSGWYTKGDWTDLFNEVMTKSVVTGGRSAIQLDRRDTRAQQSRLRGMEVDDEGSKGSRFSGSFSEDVIAHRYKLLFPWEGGNVIFSLETESLSPSQIGAFEDTRQVVLLQGYQEILILEGIQCQSNSITCFRRFGRRSQG